MISTLKSTLARGMSTLAVATLGFGLFGAMPAWAKVMPVKVESENVVFYGDVDPELAKERVLKWEIYRKMIYALSGIANPPADSQKLTIYGFQTGDELRTFTSNPGIAGVYAPSVDGPIFLTSISNKYQEEGWSEQVGFHEYTHHVLHSIVKEGFPRWYDEGFANYLATMQITDDTVVIGDPAVGHVKSVADYKLDWLDPETVLGAYAFYPNYTRRELRKGGGTVFYAQAWLYVHYLRSKPEYNEKLPEYLKLLDSPDLDPIEAFEKAYGVDIKKFHKEASKYFRKNEFVMSQYQPGPAIMSADMTVERLDEGELELAQIPARLRFASNRNRGDFRRDLMKAYEYDPSHPLVSLGFVSLDLRDENYDDAVARGDATAAAAPNDPHALRTGADARFHRAYNAFYEDMEDDEYAPLPESDDMKIALDRFSKVLQIDPYDYDAASHLILYYGNSDADVTDVAFDAARMYDARYMETFNAGDGMNLATIYAKRGFELDACEYYKRALDQTEDYTEKQMGSFNARLDWFKSNYGQSCQLEEEGEG